MKTTTRKPTGKRREEIAQAVLRIIGEQGLTSLTTATLAAEVGVTTGALYRHFASLDEILAETVRLAVERLEATFPDVSLPPLDRLLTLARNRVRVLGNDPGLAWLLRSEQAYLTLPTGAAEPLRDIARRSRDFLLDTLREGIESGSIRGDIAPDLLLVPVLGTIHAVIGSGREDPERVLLALVRLLEPHPSYTFDRLKISEEGDRKMSINAESKVGQIAAEHPLATRVFARHGLDFCCGGGRPLGEVCSERGLESGTILAEIEREIAAPSTSEVRWDQAPINDLVEHILVAYHAPLAEELPRLEAMARKVAKVHGDKRPVELPELLSVYLVLKAELEQHMAKEEQILFPMIKAGQGAMAEGPISVMEQEHDSAGGALKRLRELTDDYQVPEEACNTWRALWHGLAALEEALHQHIHLENNILFPRTLNS
jgi:regulator of cell morphogenesis and NO signaling